MQRFLRPSEVAEILDIDKRSIYQLIRSGKIPAIRGSKKLIRIPKDEFEKVLEQWRVKPKKEVKNENT